MTPQRKIEELFCNECAFCFKCAKDTDGCYVYDKAVELHKWTKEQIANMTIKSMQHWILEHDYVDIIELEDYIKQQMEDDK